MTIIFQYPVMFFVQTCVWYTRTFLSQSPHSLTHSLVTETLYFPSNLGRLMGNNIHRMHMYAEAYMRSSICTQKHMYAHILPTKDFFASMERDQVFTHDLALHRHTTFYNQNILKHLCYMNIDLPPRWWFGWIWLCVQVWLRRILKNTRNIHGFHKRSRTAPTYNLLQPKYSQTLMLYE